MEQIIEAGIYAASGRNTQNLIVVAVTNEEIRDKMSKENATVMGAVDRDPFYGAPVVLVVLAKKENGTHVYDGRMFWVE